MIEIYGKPACASCVKAKNWCESRSLPFEYYTLDKDFTREELFEQFPEAKTFPQIKVNSTIVGGYEALLSYVENTGYNGTGYGT